MVARDASDETLAETVDDSYEKPSTMYGVSIFYGGPKDDLNTSFRKL